MADASPSDGSDEHLDFLREGIAFAEAVIRAEREPAPATDPWRDQLRVAQERIAMAEAMPPPLRTKVPVERAPVSPAEPMPAPGVDGRWSGDC